MWIDFNQIAFPSSFNLPLLITLPNACSSVKLVFHHCIVPLYKQIQARPYPEKNYDGGNSHG